jgi:hypothetical protein
VSSSSPNERPLMSASDGRVTLVLVVLMHGLR